MKILCPVILAGLVLLITALSMPQAKAARSVGFDLVSLRGISADHVLIDKSERRMDLFYRGWLVRSYRVALGWNPMGHKQYEGDGRTPEGQYYIDWANPDSSFHLSLRISYPDEDDRAHAARLNKSPGGMIMIHGLPNGRDAAFVNHPGTDWTDGCIAVTNEEMREIWRLVDVGTPVTIRP